MSIAVSEWLAPLHVLGYALVGALITCGIVGAVALPSGKIRRYNLAPNLVPVAIAGALAILPAVAWQLGPVRGAFRDLASIDEVISARVLRDSSLSVAVDECVRLSEFYEYKRWRGLLADGVVTRPEVLERCLQEMPPEVADLLRADFADRWTEQLLTTNVGEETCYHSDSLTILGLPQGEAESRLLSCLLNAPEESTQRCCGSTIIRRGANDWLETLEVSEATSDTTIGAGLLTLAFHQQGVTAAQLSYIDAAGFNGEEGRQLALRVACAGIQQGEAGLGAHFAASLGDACPINPSTLPNSRDLWLQTCDLIHAEPPTGNAQDQLCQGTRATVVAFAVSDASRILQNAALDRSSASKLALDIDVEATRAERERPRPASISEFLKKRDVIGRNKRKVTFKPDW